MPVWRLVLILLLSIAIPSYGAGTVGMHDHCPTPARVAGVEKASTGGVCCDDMGGHDHQQSSDACAKVCGASGDCRSLNLLQPFTVSSPGGAFRALLFPGAPVRLARFDPSAVWRPPCTL